LSGFVGYEEPQSSELTEAPTSLLVDDLRDWSSHLEHGQGLYAGPIVVWPDWSHGDVVWRVKWVKKQKGGGVWNPLGQKRRFRELKRKMTYPCMWRCKDPYQLQDF
jgi:hypothetical protein